MDNRLLSEILIRSHQHSVISIGTTQDLRITRVVRPIPGPDGIVSQSEQVRLGPAPNARIQENPHEPASTSKGSTRSRLTTR